jgi:RNA polymerase sigma-70 factor, ECF subfamily
MSEFTLFGNALCQPAAAAVDETLHMDEERFRAFYDRTARPLWCYLARITGDRSAADDLVQETYYRLLRTKLPDMGETQLKSYLFRIASNLLRDNWRKAKREPAVISGQDAPEAVSPLAHPAQQMEHRSEIANAFLHLKPRERELLWLAYVEGSSHKEIAAVSGLRENSIRPLLFRARQKLASVLRGTKTAASAGKS